MKRKPYVTYLVIASTCLVLLTACPGVADYDLDLPGGYSVVRTSAHHVFIAPKRADTGGWGSNVIPEKVTEVAWDEKYILAKQIDLKADPESSNGYEIPDEENYHFWILEFETGEVTGPLDDDGFSVKRSEFGITADVVLQEVDGSR